MRMKMRTICLNLEHTTGAAVVTHVRDVIEEIVVGIAVEIVTIGAIGTVIHEMVAEAADVVIEGRILMARTIEMATRRALMKMVRVVAVVVVVEEMVIGSVAVSHAESVSRVSHVSQYS
jgi:hypothetical protein